MEGQESLADTLRRLHFSAVGASAADLPHGEVQVQGSFGALLQALIPS